MLRWLLERWYALVAGDLPAIQDDEAPFMLYSDEYPDTHQRNDDESAL